VVGIEETRATLHGVKGTKDRSQDLVVGGLDLQRRGEADQHREERRAEAKAKSERQKTKNKYKKGDTSKELREGTFLKSFDISSSGY